MSFFRVSNPNATPLNLPDLGITIAASATNVVLSNQFSVDDLYVSADLEAAIIAGNLTVEINYGTGFAGVAAVDYTNRDALAAFLNIFEITNDNANEELVSGNDTSKHKHDQRYYTETEIGAVSGAGLVGFNNSGLVYATGSTVQQAIGQLDAAIAASAPTLDNVYTNDTDGILLVNGVTKPLKLRSNNTNGIFIDRISGADIQNFLRANPSADELQLGSLLVGALAQIDVRILSNLIIDGNLTVTGTVTDTTVNELNVTNANIRLRDGATLIAGADAALIVERGTSGTDADILWSHTDTRWKAGLQGSEQTIALLERNENVTGVWKFTGAASTDPSFWYADKAAAPTTQLGAAGEIPTASINNTLAYYDRTRTKWLAVAKEYMQFSGRDSANNSNEYARFGLFTSNQAGGRLMRNVTLTAIAAQTNGAETWTVRVRKNGSVTNLASLAITAASGDQATNLNVDFNAGDDIEVYIDGSNIDRPAIRLEFQQRF